MTDENRRVAIEAEWQRAQEALAEADILLGADKPVGAVSRSYYGAFHAAQALLFSLGLQPRTHQGARSMIGLHFVRPGRLSPRLAHALSQAARSREDADYVAGSVFTREEAQEALRIAREFAEGARAILANDGWLPAG